jgi:hypothetical protein
MSGLTDKRPVDVSLKASREELEMITYKVVADALSAAHLLPQDVRKHPSSEGHLSLEQS